MVYIEVLKYVCCILQDIILAGDLESQFAKASYV